MECIGVDNILLMMSYAGEEPKFRSFAWAHPQDAVRWAMTQCFDAPIKLSGVTLTSRVVD